MSNELVPVEDDRNKVGQTLSRLPAISADQYQYLGKYSGAIVQHVFQAIGGVDRMAAWATSNPTDFYSKIWAKTIQKSAQVDHAVTLTVDEAINRLEAQQGDYREVPSQNAEPADFVDFEDEQEYDL